MIGRQVIIMAFKSSHLHDITGGKSFEVYKRDMSEASDCDSR